MLFEFYVLFTTKPTPEARRCRYERVAHAVAACPCCVSVHAWMRAVSFSLSCCFDLHKFSCQIDCLSCFDFWSFLVIKIQPRKSYIHVMMNTLSSKRKLHKVYTDPCLSVGTLSIPSLCFCDEFFFYSTFF